MAQLWLINGESKTLKRLYKVISIEKNGQSYYKKDQEKGLDWACLYRNGKISDSFYTNDSFCVEFKFSKDRLHIGVPDILVLAQ